MHMADVAPQEQHDEFGIAQVEPVNAQTYFWIFLMSFYIIATGIGLYLAMGNIYITIPQGTFPLR